METLRKSLMPVYSVKLTKEESRSNIRKSIRNISWEDRDDPSTHPYFKGPFTMKNVHHYHIYCSLEMWMKLGEDPKRHWDYRESDSIVSYNPSMFASGMVCHMMLPISQRRWKWRPRKTKGEIFDDLRPHYIF